METAGAVEPFRPPYMSFSTFWGFTTELSEHPLPPVIDRSLMNSKSGTDQANLLAALRTFGLVDAANQVQQPLIELANRESDVRKQELRRLVEEHYAAALVVSKNNGTAAQLRQCFRDEYEVDGETGRKAVTFFLHAARFAEIELSPHFPQTRSGQGGPGRAKARKSATKKRDTAAEPGASEPDQSPAAGSGSNLTVNLRSGGVMKLSVSVDPITLRGDDRRFFFEIVDALTDYQERQAAQAEDSPSAS